MNKYRIEYSRRGSAWENLNRHEIPEDTNNLDQWIAVADDLESHEGKYSYRIIDTDSNVVWTAINAEYAPNINLLDPDWLAEIQSVYGFYDVDFAAACRHWLAAHPALANESDLS